MNEGLALLRTPFPANQISKLPKNLKRGDDDKGKCLPGSKYSADGHFCGGWHAKSIHLDYVGHAALTDRLLDADAAWTWEPLSMSEGLPVLDGYGGMWIKLTVCGVTRMGYGHAGDKQGGDAIKEIIGDALRNAAIRFGAALELWHKGELHAAEEPANTLEAQLEASIEHVRTKKNGAMGDAWAEADRALATETKRSLRKFSERIAPMAPAEAYDLIEEQGLNHDEKTFLWGFLDSKLRSALKQHKETQQLLLMKDRAQ